MRFASLLIAVVGVALGTADAFAGRFGKAGTEGALRVRYFTAEIPPASEGGQVRVGVKLPLGDKIARTLVFIDSEDKADRKDWSKCDVEKKTCAIGDARILRFHREDREKWQDLAVDVESSTQAPRFVKLTVRFQPQSGFDRSGCSRTNMRCGYAGPVE